MDFLCTIPMYLVEKAVREAVELDVATIRNKSAYLMGFLKTKVAQLSEDPANLTNNAGSRGAKAGRSRGEEGHRGRGRSQEAVSPGGGGGGDEVAEVLAEPVDFFSSEPLKRKRYVKLRNVCAWVCV